MPVRQALESKLHDLETMNPGLDPMLYDRKQAVVSESCSRSVDRAGVRASSNADRKPSDLASDKSSIVGVFEGLISHLTLGLRIVAPRPGVDDVVTVILIVGVPTRHNDGIRALSLRAVNAGHRRRVNSGSCELGAVRVDAADGRPR